jgi:hypothetical protein
MSCSTLPKGLLVAIAAGLMIAAADSPGDAGAALAKASAPMANVRGGDAITVIGSQNPLFRVRVSIKPAHPTIGQTVVARFRITNVTQRTRHGEWQFTFSTPVNGIGAAVAGPLRPGIIAGETLRQKVTAKTPSGRYIIYAEVSNRHGSSHAKAHATFVSPAG